MGAGMTGADDAGAGSYPFAAATYHVISKCYDDTICDMLRAVWPFRHEAHMRGFVRNVLSSLRRLRTWTKNTEDAEKAYRDIHANVWRT